MGGDNHMLHDPSIERWAAMRENVYQHFKFTRRNTRTIMLLGVVVPVAIGALCLKYDAKSDWAGKTRGQSLLARPPPAEEKSE